MRTTRGHSSTIRKVSRAVGIGRRIWLGEESLSTSNKFELASSAGLLCTLRIWRLSGSDPLVKLCSRLIPGSAPVYLH